MKYKMNFFIVSLFLTSSAFAMTCFDTLDTYNEDMKKHRKAKKIEDAKNLSHDAQDFLCLKKSQLDKRYADAQERLKVLGILWQSHDLGDGLLFNDAPTDTLTAGHFRALKVMSAGIKALYQDPTLGAGFFFQYMESTIKTSFGKEFHSYFEQKNLKTLFPDAFFTEILKCGSTDENKMDQLDFAAAVRGEDFIVEGNDFFMAGDFKTRFEYKKYDLEGPFERVDYEIFYGLDPVDPSIEKRGSSDYGYIAYIKPTASQEEFELFNGSPRTKGTSIKEPMAKPEDIIAYFAMNNLDFDQRIFFDGKFFELDGETYYAPLEYVSNYGIDTVATYIERMLKEKQITVQQLIDRLSKDEKTRELALNDHWKALLKLLDNLNSKDFISPSIVEAAKTSDPGPALSRLEEVIQTFEGYMQNPEIFNGEVINNRRKGIKEKQNEIKNLKKRIAFLNKDKESINNEKYKLIFWKGIKRLNSTLKLCEKVLLRAEDIDKENFEKSASVYQSKDEKEKIECLISEFISELTDFKILPSNPFKHGLLSDKEKIKAALDSLENIDPSDLTKILFPDSLAVFSEERTQEIDEKLSDLHKRALDLLNKEI